MTLDEAKQLRKGETIETVDNLEKPVSYEGRYEFLKITKDVRTTVLTARSKHKIRGEYRTVNWFPERFKSPNRNRVIKENYNI